MAFLFSVSGAHVTKFLDGHSRMAPNRWSDVRHKDFTMSTLAENGPLSTNLKLDGNNPPFIGV
jgi:hypothetical protein